VARRGANVAVRQRGVASSGTHGRCTIGAETGEGGGADLWASATVPVVGGLNKFHIQTNSNYFKTFQTLTDLKMAFHRSKKFK
jgi:hypothetical protein